MARTTETSGEMQGGGNWMNKPGNYHFVITSVMEEAVDNSNKPIGGFRYNATCVEGTDKSQIGKTIKLDFRDPSPTHKDGGDMCRKKQTAALLAVDVITPDDLGKNVTYDIDDKLNHRQFCAAIEVNPGQKEGSVFADLSYANIYHVDDPHCKDWPKAKPHLDVYRHPTIELRHDAAYFERIYKKADGGSNGHANGNGNGSSKGGSIPNVDLAGV